MSANCITSGLSFDNGDFCLPVVISVDQEEFTVDKSWIAGAFFLGLFIGGGLTALCVKPFLSSWEKKKRQDAEAMLEEEVFAKSVLVEERQIQTEETLYLVNGTNKTKIKQTSRFKQHKKTQEEDESSTHKIKIDLTRCRGMVDVISQTNSMAAEVEMADQDMDILVAMERGQEKEKETVLLKILSFLLRKKASKRIVTDVFVGNFVKKVEQDLHDIRHMIDREKEEAEEMLKKDPKLAKDTEVLETELQKLQTKYRNRQGQLQREYKENIRLDLIKMSGMPEDEVEDVMEKLKAQMANLEEKLAVEQTRQRRALDKRLAERREIMEYREVLDAEKKEARTQRINLFKSLLGTKVKSGQLLERQNDDLINEYSQNLDNLSNLRKKENEGQWHDISDRLRRNRLSHMEALLEKQAKEMSMFMLKADTSTSTADIVKGYHDMLTQHHRQQEELSNQLDLQDVEAMETLNKETLKEDEKARREEDEKLIKNLENLTDISQNEANKLLQLHKQRMDEYSAKQQREKQAMMARLQERLQQRIMLAAEAETRDAQDQRQLQEEQIQTMQRVLASNMDLTEEAKAKVLKQHEENMQVLSNQLQRSKMRQQKSLEIKLNQRRVRLFDLKRQQEEMQQSRKEMNEKERKKLEEELAAQIAAEEARLEEARQSAVAELRRQLAAETEEAIRVQDQEIGLLIGRLQVGQARRKAILERQDKTLKDLQEQLEHRVTSGQNMPGMWTDQLLQQHYNHMDQLNKQLQYNKQIQEKQLAEKLKVLKKQKQEEIETQLEQEAQKEYTIQQTRGAGYASFALMQSFLEQRHHHAMVNMERELMTELEREKDELNRQMEHDLQNDLQAQRQNLLTQLAAVTNLSRNELEDAVDAAAAGKQSKKTTKKLAKDLKAGIERAKSSMDFDYGEQPSQATDLRRMKTTLYSGDLEERDAMPPLRGQSRDLSQRDTMPPVRVQSGKRFLKKQAFLGDMQEEDNEF